MNRTYKITLSLELNEELRMACQECAPDPEDGEPIHPHDFLLGAIEATLASRRLPRFAALKAAPVETLTCDLCDRHVPENVQLCPDCTAKAFHGRMGAA